MSDIATTKTFEEKMTDKIRDSVGELIDKDELNKIIARTLEKIMFTEKVVRNNFNQIQSREPSLADAAITVEVKALVEKEVKKLVKEYVATQEHYINEQIKTMLNDNGKQVVLSALSSIFANTLDQFRYNVQTDLTNINNSQY